MPNFPCEHKDLAKFRKSTVDAGMSAYLERCVLNCTASPPQEYAVVDIKLSSLSFHF